MKIVAFIIALIVCYIPLAVIKNTLKENSWSKRLIYTIVIVLFIGLFSFISHLITDNIWIDNLFLAVSIWIISYVVNFIDSAIKFNKSGDYSFMELFNTQPVLKKLLDIPSDIIDDSINRTIAMCVYEHCHEKVVASEDIILSIKKQMSKVSYQQQKGYMLILSYAYLYICNDIKMATYWGNQTLKNITCGYEKDLIVEQYKWLRKEQRIREQVFNPDGSAIWAFGKKTQDTDKIYAAKLDMLLRAHKNVMGNIDNK